MTGPLVCIRFWYVVVNAPDVIRPGEGIRFVVPDTPKR
jgi:hypothetical protein